jgi:hypothetical protein
VRERESEREREREREREKGDTSFWSRNNELASIFDVFQSDCCACHAN